MLNKLTLESMLNKKAIAQILEYLPQNRPLYRDTDLWKIYHDDDYNNEPICEQKTNETFKDFLIRYIVSCLSESELEDLCIDLVCDNRGNIYEFAATTCLICTQQIEKLKIEYSKNPDNEKVAGDIFWLKKQIQLAKQIINLM